MTILGISISMTVFWLVAAVVFIIVEGLTMGLTTIWFAGGAVVALLVSLLTESIPIQAVVFFLVSAVLLIFTRKFFVEKLHTGQVKTNVDALIGREAIVVKAIRPFEPGVVKIGGQEWTAVCENPKDAAEVNAAVEVIGIEGVKAIVAPLHK